MFLRYFWQSQDYTSEKRSYLLIVLSFSKKSVWRVYSLVVPSSRRKVACELIVLGLSLVHKAAGRRVRWANKESDFARQQRVLWRSFFWRFRIIQSIILVFRVSSIWQQNGTSFIETVTSVCLWTWCVSGKLGQWLYVIKFYTQVHRLRGIVCPEREGHLLI